MKAGDIVFIDTNVLLAATDRTRSHHQAALGVLEGLPDAGVHLTLSGQVIREYLVVSTRPIESNGLGLGWKQALLNVKEFRSRAEVLEETTAVNNALIDLVRRHRLTGKRIHDANIAATAITHGVDGCISDDAGAYKVFGTLKILSSEEALSARD